MTHSRLELVTQQVCNSIGPQGDALICLRHAGSCDEIWQVISPFACTSGK